MKTLAAIVVLALCAGSVVGKGWDRANNPQYWDASFEHDLSKLPTSGQSTNTPWSDTYWPSYQGGIALRWQDSESNHPGFDYHLNTLNELKNGSVDINILSPAEKFDIFNSRYDYPLTKSEWQRCNASDAMWEGICHGWAPAAGHYQQPNATVLTNKEGLTIPFMSSDVKALLSYFLAQYAQGQESTQFIAQRCNTDIDEDPSKAENPECADINAGSFHVVLTNMLGIAKKAFVGDIDRSIQVWNQPLTAYQYQLGPKTRVSNTSAHGAVSQQAVNFTMYYTKETVPARTAHEALILHETYKYTLDLDASGKIIGGTYDDDQWHRMDFLWSEEAPAFFGYFASLQTIYDKSIGQVSTRMGASHRARLSDFHAVPVTSGSISLSSYDAHTRRSWFVHADSHDSLRLHFTAFNTRRHSDHVRVYEVSEDGNVGALVAVLHGSKVPKDIVLRRGVSALLTFGVDQKSARKMSPVTGKGFEVYIF